MGQERAGEGSSKAFFSRAQPYVRYTRVTPTTHATAQPWHVRSHGCAIRQKDKTHVPLRWACPRTGRQFVI